MQHNFSITSEEKKYLRELAKKQLEYANLPIMEDRKRLWYAHNALKGERPVVVMEMQTFHQEILPPSRCESPAAKEMEWFLQMVISNHEWIDDDKVVSPFYNIDYKIEYKQFGIGVNLHHSTDSSGRSVGYQFEHPIKDLEQDFHKLKPSVYSVDREYTNAWKHFVEETIGDILPVRIRNKSLEWSLSPSQKIVELMGLENMMVSLLDCPEKMHELYRFIVDDIKAFVGWQEKEGLLTLNNENDYAGAGSFGFSHELPSKAYKEGGRVTPKDMWGNLNSQETVCVSPAMYGEFITPYYNELAEMFGLMYYGCCEPVHPIWDKHVSKMPSLRKVSISPWCDEDYMAEALRGGNVIYSRKPSPNFVGASEIFDESAFREHLEKTIRTAKGCHLEIIMRDVYTVFGDKERAGRAVKIIRELIDTLW